VWKTKRVDLRTLSPPGVKNAERTTYHGSGLLKRTVAKREGDNIMGKQKRLLNVKDSKRR